MDAKTIANLRRIKFSLKLLEVYDWVKTKKRLWRDKKTWCAEFEDLESSYDEDLTKLLTQHDPK